MEIDAKIAYEIALNRVLEKEKQIIELTALYAGALDEIDKLKEELKQLRGE